MGSPPTSQSSSLPSRPWSLYFFIAWAFVLAFNTGVVLWDITGPLTQFGSPHTAFGWLSLALAFVAPFGFGTSVYGLWGLRPWGRYLFLALSTLFFGVNLVGVWLPTSLPLTPQALTQLHSTRLLASARYGLAIVVPVAYFNLSRIRPLFQQSNWQFKDSTSQSD